MIVGVGSRGDVAPYVGLGRHLQEAGCAVAVATHDTFAAMVGEAGLEWRRLPGDPRSLIQARMRSGAPAASLADVRADTTSFLAGIGDGIADAALLGTDVVLTCLGQAPLSCLVAAGLGIPSMGVYLVPSVPTAEFPLPGAGPAGDRVGHREAGHRRLDRARSLYADVVPALVRRLGLPASAGEAVWDQWLGATGWPISHGFSTAVVPRPADWPSSVDVVGYWWSARPPGWRPTPALTEFLAAGPAPVFVGFGSMAVGAGERLGPVIAEAIGAAGVRAVVQAGWAEVSLLGDDVRQSDDVLQVGDTPHEWLLPRMAAAVHHAGAGTTAAVLRAGRPSVAVPVMADQPFWAERLHRLGAAPEPIPFESLTSERLAVAIRAVRDEPGYRQRATELAGRLADDDGASAVLARLERLVG